MNSELVYIGEIRTPYKTLDECPNNISSDGPRCELVIYDDFTEGLYGLLKSQKIMVLYWLDLSKRTVGILKSRFDGRHLGTFALRTPIRPNPIGVAILEISDVSDNTIVTNGLDCVDGTKILDIKPVI